MELATVEQAKQLGLLPEEFEKIYAAITARDIQRVAQIIFDTKRLTVAVIGNGLDKEGIKKVL